MIFSLEYSSFIGLFSSETTPSPPRKALIYFQCSHSWQPCTAARVAHVNLNKGAMAPFKNGGIWVSGRSEIILLTHSLEIFVEYIWIMSQNFSSNTFFVLLKLTLICTLIKRLHSVIWWPNAVINSHSLWFQCLEGFLSTIPDSEHGPW